MYSSSDHAHAIQGVLIFAMYSCVFYVFVHFFFWTACCVVLSDVLSDVSLFLTESLFVGLSVFFLTLSLVSLICFHRDSIYSPFFFVFFFVFFFLFVLKSC